MDKLLSRKRCSDEKKKCFSLSEAKRISHDMSEKYGEIMLPYYCKKCGLYHIGHPPKTVLITWVNRSGRKRQNGNKVKSLVW